MALLVPASRRVMPGVLLETLSEHYSSPGRLAAYRRRFGRISRKPGDDPSVFAVELETLAMRAFGDLCSSVRLQLVRDRFIAGQIECSLQRNLDGVEPGTPIQDIVWESHAEDTACWEADLIPNRSLPVYLIDDVEPEDGPVSDLDDRDLLQSLVRQLLPTPAVSPPRVALIPSEHEQFIQRLLGKEPPVLLLLPECNNLTDMDILLQSLLPVGSLTTEHHQPVVGTYEATVMCFSCGESGYPAARCPVLDDMFPFLPPGWQADWTGDDFVMRTLPAGRVLGVALPHKPFLVRRVRTVFHQLVML